MHAINNVDLGISEDNSKFHSRSTWTRTTPRVQSPPHTSAHTLHHRRHAACLSWHLQGCSVRPRRKHSPAIAGVRITVHNTPFKLAWPKQRQQSMPHALHPSCPLTRVLLPAILGRRRIAPAVILHGPTLLVTASPTLVGAIGLDRRVLRVGSVAAVGRAVSDGACTTSQAIQSGRPPQQRQDGQTMIPWRAA